MTLSNLPPGVTDAMIEAQMERECPRCGLLNGHRYPCTDETGDEEAAGAFDDDFSDLPEEACPGSEDGCHSFVENGDEQHHGEGRTYCEWCGADGDA